MKLTTTIFLSLLVAAECSQHQRYELPPPGSYGGSTIFLDTFPGEAHTPSIVEYSNDNTDIQNNPVYRESFTCSHGQVLHVDGRCVTPQVMRHVYVYNVPEQHRRTGPPPPVPPPKVEHNIVFVRLPERTGDQDPIVVPPPQQKNIVYVLNKGTTEGGQKVITVPPPPKSKPEVYFVNYGDGQNPTLPGGVDLQTALKNAKHQGVSPVIGGGSKGGITYGGISSGSGHDVSVGSSISGGTGYGGIIDGGIIDGGIIDGGIVDGGNVYGDSTNGEISYPPPRPYVSP
ncbi:uncharacterized protein [Palaemon carinicauda]|uniref:uncharacterized protein isoform X1 n=1 Tax=Palaemon carinicauda TaxID=392227 RepID=UPI0035B6811D